MTRTNLTRSWIIAPPLRGRWIALWIVVALPVAAVVDSAMNCPDMIGECCTPYFLFVMMTAVLFGWRTAAVTAVLSAVTSYYVSSLNGMHMHADAGEVFGMGLFVLYSAVVIALVELIRATVFRFARLPNVDEYSSGIIFSLEKGQAWASWPGQPIPVRLGPQQEVEAMMANFLATGDLAQRLHLSAGLALRSDSTTPL